MASSQQQTQIASRYEKVQYEIKPRAYRYRRSKNIDPYSMVYERDPYSTQQNFLYKRAMFGLSVYDQSEIELMHWQKRKRIQKVHKRTQLELNLWKQDIVNKWTNKFFEVLFPNNKLTTDLLRLTDIDPQYKNTSSFTDLGIGKDAIVNKLIDVGILPAHFHNLK
jgi:hypothetical protein